MSTDVAGSQVQLSVLSNRW